MIEILLAAALLGQAPAPPPMPRDLKAEHAAGLSKVVQKKRIEAAKKAVQRNNRAQAEYQRQREMAAYQARMAPIVAAQQAEAARLSIEQQKANALSSVANAAQREANIDASRLSIQARQAGYPQFGLQQIVPGPNGYVGPYVPRP